MADEKRWHRFRHYPERWSTFDLIEACEKPKWCCGCEFNHPFCSENGRVEPIPAHSATDGGQ
jgi:hypothetical protein